MIKLDSKDYDISKIVKEDIKERIKTPIIIISVYVVLFIAIIILTGINGTPRECQLVATDFLTYSIFPLLILLFIVSFTTYSVNSIYATDYKMDERSEVDKHYVKDDDTAKWVEVEKTKFITILTDGFEHTVIVRKTLFSTKILELID